MSILSHTSTLKNQHLFGQWGLCCPKSSNPASELAKMCFCFLHCLFLSSPRLHVLLSREHRLSGEASRPDSLATWVQAGFQHRRHCHHHPGQPLLGFHGDSFESPFFFFFFFNFYWSIVALQCCVRFYCTAK